jgi:hypothetical protein
VFVVGMAFGRPSQTRETSTISSAAAVEAARAEAYAQAKAEQPSLPLAFDLAVPKGAKPVDEMLTVEPGARTRVDAVALGRHWSKERFDALGKLSEGLRKSPQQLDDKKVVAEVMRFMTDRSTSRVVLEVLAEVATPRALDLLYEIWIGSKERNETTQLAEALLLAKDVRTRASAALNLCLNLREKPTQCEQVSQLVQTAIREGDRRAAMLLVNTGARVNCGPAGDQECIKCLAEPKDLRKAVHASVARPDPVQ